MLTHVVCFRFADLETAGAARDRLLSMRGAIPALLELEAGVDTTRSPRSFDLALITRHADRAGLEAYGQDPLHLEVLEWLKPRVVQAVAVDF
jgi:hypothetical protein